MYQGEKCSVIWGGSDASGRLIWVISRKKLIWGFLFVFWLWTFLSWTTTKLLCFNQWLYCVTEKKNQIRSRTKANSLIFRHFQPFHEKFLLPIAHYHIITTKTKKKSRLKKILQHDIVTKKLLLSKWAFVSLFCLYVHRIIAIYTWYLSSFLVEKCLATSVVWGNLGTTTTKPISRSISCMSYVFINY